jgi:hypothetical protein
VKRTYPVIPTLFVFFLFLLACTRIDTTRLGSGLLPAVDNVNTFDTVLEVQSDNLLMTDTTKAFNNDDMALGYISNDPEFGQTVAEMYFNITAAAGTVYPFVFKDSVKTIDSVVLQLDFKGSYGDTVAPQTYRVYEIGNSTNFKDTSYYLKETPFRPLGTEVGNKTVAFKDLNDTITLKLAPDTPKIVNVMRIKLNNSLGQKLVDIDSNAYKKDADFRAIFRGLAVIPDTNNSANGLAYFNLEDKTRSKLIVYYRVGRAGKIDTTFAEFNHDTTGHANLIRRKPAGNFATYLNNGSPTDDQLYIQSTPGSYAALKIPGLSGLNNRIIHRAELRVTRLETPSDVKFAPPLLLFLDAETTDRDSAYTIQNDFLLSPVSGTLGRYIGNFDVFGGQLKNNTYKFTLTRYVQGIITRKEPNQTLRLYAPYEPAPYFVPPGTFANYLPNQLSILSFGVIDQFARGRVVLWGGNAPDPSKKLQLYIIYSKI